MTHQVTNIAGVPDDVSSSFPGNVNTHDSDLHRAIINDYFHRHTATTTTLTATATTGDTSVTVVDASGFSAGSLIHFGATDVYTEPLHPHAIAVVSNTITLDRPLDNTYPAGSTVILAVDNMTSAAGSLASPISYIYRPRNGNVEHIKRFIISMVHGAAADDSKFGSLTALSNGVVFRGYINGAFRTLTNWKANSDIILDMYEVAYTDKAGPGAYGTKALGEFRPLDTTISLDSATGDYLQILIQDDITTMTSFKIKVQGHIEGA